MAPSAEDASNDAGHGAAGILTVAWRSAGWYAGNEEWLVIQRGVFSRTSTAAWIDQIQFVRWSQGMFSRPNTTFSLAISVPTSGGAGILALVLAFLRRPVDPSIIKVRALSAGDAWEIAQSSGFERSLPPGMAAKVPALALP